MERESLHEGWRMTVLSGPALPADLAGAEVPAAVPGCAHLDLLAAGLIPDPCQDRNEAALAWAHRAEWRYTLDFAAAPPAPGERTDLVFDGLDTVTTIELDGRRIGATANMHRGHRFDIRGPLTAGGNGNGNGGGDGAGRHTLAVTFHSALEHAERLQRELGERPRAYPHPFNMVRKMACSFGWDWGPDLQTAGIWKPVRLERWHTARIAALRPLATVTGSGAGRVEVHLRVERSGLEPAGDLLATARIAEHEVRTVIPAAADEAVLTLQVPDVLLWWPAGHGDQPLYGLDVTLARPGGAEPQRELDSAGRRIGFRTVTVDTTPDETGTPFTFVVNGTRIFAKGANWIPDDHFLTRITRERLARRIDQALGAHMNMLRVWGGGIYETDDFYDLCDERGILVWQDFLFACAAYPEEEPLRGEVEAEARENVTRLCSHPSLVLWNGGNENLWGYRDWGWREELAGRTWGLGYYLELLPRIVAELDPGRPYADGSPYTPGQAPDGIHPNDQDHGSRHEWEVWNRADYTHYRDHIPRFCSEFGFQGPPAWATLTDAVHDDPLTPLSPGFRQHQKAEDGNGKLERGLAPHLPVPADFTDWHWATQLNQARAVAFGIEHFRSWWPRTAGAVVWQLNDCWPATSWAAVDGAGRPKPLWYALRRAFAPRLLTVQPRNGRPALAAVNDTARPWTGELRLARQTLGGVIRAEDKIALDVPPRSAALLPLPGALAEPGKPEEEVLVVTADDARTCHLFAEDRELAYRPAPLRAEAVAVPGGYRVDVHAESFARDIAVFADRLAPDAEADDMLVTLAAGESHSFLVRTAAALDPAALTRPPVLRTANDLRAGRS
ncbi:glycoside hydrolase family 2 protein [Streptomyces aidingensis]|uniref:beta-mannosidase n=1 Tax=Streptomyces aidingensis TaxID=910347 RepID=A0A1I1SIQ0_9ACTN|nr:glycoside hydrolase family 2 protein [Streptomyces aidingensis]SFD46344.1 beta-mannosidase [Streptomyces aidingensis]